MAAKPSAIIILFCTILSACGGRLTGGDSAAPQTVAVAPASTPAQRAVQVAWTAAGARYCAFGLNPQKLRADYLAWETSHGASPESITSLGATYDKAFLTFYDKVKETPGYCSKAKIEEIRPEINRHLAGDYEPKKNAPVVAQKKPTIRIREKDSPLKDAFNPRDN